MARVRRAGSRSLGLRRGDHIAILLENHPRFFQICWAAQRSGLYYTPISWRLQPPEVEYIVNNCEAKLFVTSAARAEVVATLVDKIPNVTSRYVISHEGTVGTLGIWLAIENSGLKGEVGGAVSLPNRVGSRESS